MILIRLLVDLGTLDATVGIAEPLDSHACLQSISLIRKFQHFNMAMLAKQCWRLVTDEESLVSKILKARYFPRTSFWEAKIGFQPSYVWRSMLKARKVLEMGCRWNIGDRNKVKI